MVISTEYRTLISPHCGDINVLYSVLCTTTYCRRKRISTNKLDLEILSRAIFFILFYFGRVETFSFQFGVK